MKLMNLQKNYYDLKFIMNSRNVKKEFKLKIFKVMKLTFEIIFSQMLLCITFDDRFWIYLILIFYIWVPNLAIEVLMKLINFKQHFATTYRHLTKKTTAFVYRSTCLVHFTMLAPNYIFQILIWKYMLLWHQIILNNTWFGCAIQFNTTLLLWMHIQEFKSIKLYVWYRIQ